VPREGFEPPAKCLEGSHSGLSPGAEFNSSGLVYGALARSDCPSRRGACQDRIQRSGRSPDATLGPGLAALDELDLLNLPAEPDLDPARASAPPITGGCWEARAAPTHTAILPAFQLRWRLRKGRP
jgi:hypothetical protein